MYCARNRRCGDTRKLGQEGFWCKHLHLMPMFRRACSLLYVMVPWLPILETHILDLTISPFDSPPKIMRRVKLENKFEVFSIFGWKFPLAEDVEIARGKFLWFCKPIFFVNCVFHVLIVHLGTLHLASAACTPYWVEIHLG